MKQITLKVALIVGLFVWGGVIVLWPTESNRVGREIQSPHNTAREGLHKSPLTVLNYGMLGFQLFETNEGKKHWNIKSDFAEFHRKSNYAAMKGVNAEFYAQSTGNLFLTRSKYGRSLLDRQLVELNQDVSIQSKQGYLFSMDQVTYNGDTREFYSDDLVHMTGPDVKVPRMKMKGQGLMANIDRELFILKEKVTAERRLQTDEKLFVDSESCEFFSNDQRAVFIGTVQSKLSDMTIDSDLFELDIAEDKENLLARGNVTVNTRDRVGQAEKAFLEVGSDIVILEGNARVKSKNNIITGKRIKLYTDDDQVEVILASGQLRE